MAQIHGSSNCIKYLQAGTKPVNGKRLETLEEMQHFYSHYNEILADTKTATAQREDEIIAGLGREEARLNAELIEGIARQRILIDKEICELNHMRSAANSFFSRLGFAAKYWFAVALRTHHINSPYVGISDQLDQVRYDKRHHAEYKQATIERECSVVIRSYDFLKNNESFLIGAQGEEYVIGTLSQLPGEYHIINDVNLRFERAIHWRKYHEYVKTCQIDHIVAGPTGIFLLETKNWKRSDIGSKADNLTHQVQRAGLAHWYYTKDYYRGKSDRPKVRNVVVSIKGSDTGRHLDKYIDIVTPGHLCNYIRNRQSVLSNADVEKYVRIITKNRF